MKTKVSFKKQNNMKRATTSFAVVVLFFCNLFIQSCVESQQNLNRVGEDKFTALEIEKLPEGLIYKDTTYVPVYSDIYSETKDVRFNLTATLSLRNTSFKHDIYVSEVDYFDSHGKKTKSFLTKPIELGPMQSVEYVIDENDTSGGTGANFIINWSAKNEKVKPLFQGIMISTRGQLGISFSTTGLSISNQ